MRTFAGFREFVETMDNANEVKTVILHALDANPGALDDPVSNFRKYRDLLDAEKNPQLANMIQDSDNRGAILTAIKNASTTDLSIADLISLFTAPPNDKIPDSIG